MKDSQEQLKLMTQQMDELAVEKAELEARNKILKHVVRMNADCIDRLQSHKVCLLSQSACVLCLYHASLYFEPL